MTMTRRLIVVVLALLMGLQVIRNAAVAALAETRPATAAKVWHDHPDVESTQTMTAIGDAARRGREVDPAWFQAMNDAAAKAALAPEPFLVRGVRAQLSGDSRVARSAFLAAQWRDPRSLPARYFLADEFFRSGDARAGLNEFAVLARLAPGGDEKVAPYLAAYAKDRANWPQLRTVLRSDSMLEDATLAALAADPANARTLLALADASHRTATSPWLPTLLSGLVNTGQYAVARAVWADVAGVRIDPGQLLFDSGFANGDVPPPFNWALTSSTVGLAERQRGGRLHVIYYGQEDGVLAAQLLLLAPGHYRMTMGISGDRAQARPLSWSLTCEKSQTPFATTALDGAAARGWAFDVPAAACPAQRLELRGMSSDIAQQSEVTISALGLSHG
jgi:hypothetical protein